MLPHKQIKPDFKSLRKELFRVSRSLTGHHELPVLDENWKNWIFFTDCCLNIIRIVFEHDWQRSWTPVVLEEHLFGFDQEIVQLVQLRYHVDEQPLGDRVLLIHRLACSLELVLEVHQGAIGVLQLLDDFTTAGFVDIVVVDMKDVDVLPAVLEVDLEILEQVGQGDDGLEDLVARESAARSLVEFFWRPRYAIVAAKTLAYLLPLAVAELADLHGV